jgi:DNA modification methylase
LSLKNFKTKFGEYILGDVRELIKNVKTESIDAIITDPPFGLGQDEYDNPEVFFEIESELYRVLKPNAWFIFYYSTKKIFDLIKLKLFKYHWMIINYFPTSISKSSIGDRVYSPIFVFKKGRPKIAYRRADVIISDELPILQTKIKNQQFKPTFSIACLLHIFTKKGDFILDPFAGYGSIPLVCELFQRKWLAFDIDEWKFNIAKQFILEGKITEIQKKKMGKIILDEYLK